MGGMGNEYLASVRGESPVKDGESGRGVECDAHDPNVSLPKHCLLHSVCRPLTVKLPPPDTRQRETPETVSSLLCGDTELGRDVKAYQGKHHPENGKGVRPILCPILSEKREKRNKGEECGVGGGKCNGHSLGMDG